MRNPAFCLQCDDSTLLEHGARDLLIVLEGQSDTVPAVNGWHCPACGECEFDAGEANRYHNALEKLRSRVNDLRGRELRAIRKKLGLKQAEAGRLFGGGVSAFSEYERGKTQPHKSTLLLLRLLNEHPELLREVVR